MGLSLCFFFSCVTYLYDVERGIPVSFVIVGASQTPQLQSSLTVIHHSASRIFSILQQKKKNIKYIFFFVAWF